MRALVLCAALVFLGAAPQDKPQASPLDRVIDYPPISWSSDRALAIEVIEEFVCRRQGIPCIIEEDSGGPLAPTPGQGDYWQKNLQGLTVREALDEFVAGDRRYHWGELDGVIVVRPVRAWNDKRNRLNQDFPALSLVDADLRDVLTTVVNAAHGDPRQTETTLPAIGKSVTAGFGGGWMLNGLAAIARADGQIVWLVGRRFLPKEHCRTMIEIATVPPFTGSGTCLDPVPQVRPSKRD